MNLDASVAVTSLTASDIQRAVPRSTTEVLRYVPGFTRVESSGGEVNENYSMRGILGIEYVNFLEDGLPVFPTMHTSFMNADNLFRFDENVERMEVVRGGASALFGSNTPGAMHQLDQQDRRGRVRRYPAGNGRHRGARPLRPQRQRAAGRRLAVQRGWLLPLRPRRARPRLSRHPGRPGEGQRHPAPLERVRAPLGQGTSTTATSSFSTCRSRTRPTRSTSPASATTAPSTAPRRSTFGCQRRLAI